MRQIISASLIVLAIGFTGCDSGSIFGPSQEEMEFKQKQLEQEKLLKQEEINAQITIKEKEIKLKEKELALQKELKKQEAQITLEGKKAELENKKSIEVEKLKNDIKRQELEIEKEKVRAQNRETRLNYKLKEKDKENQLEAQKYWILFAVIVAILIAVGIFIYLNNKRKDKLKAYEDNMEKYFRQKETEAKLQIANKIIDTIAQGKLSPETENKLIASLNGSTNPTLNNKDVKNQIENKKNNEELIEPEVIEDDEKKEDKPNT